MADLNKLGLYKKMKIEKIQKQLDEIQSAGEESILLIANRLINELNDQGYNIRGTSGGTNAYITIYKFDGKVQVCGHNFEIREHK